MERCYIGFWNDGHDLGEIKYYSKHRNRSKKNMEDMKYTARKKYGKSALYCKFEFGYMIINSKGEEV